jgi:hypothetical protein
MEYAEDWEMEKVISGDGNLRGVAECRLNIFTGKENCEHFLTLSNRTPKSIELAIENNK